MFKMAQTLQTDTVHVDCMGVTPLRTIMSWGAQTPTSAVLKTCSFEDLQFYRGDTASAG